MNQGWECPKCGSVYAPHIVKCFTCSNNGFGGTWPKYPWQSPWTVTWGGGSTTTTMDGTTYVTINNVDKPEDPDGLVGARV